MERVAKPWPGWNGIDDDLTEADPFVEKDHLPADLPPCVKTPLRALPACFLGVGGFPKLSPGHGTIFAMGSSMMSVPP